MSISRSPRCGCRRPRERFADHARLETSTCSAQLARLGERGVVQVAGGSARRKQYYLTERLYNIYYLLRRRRGPDRFVEALIHFMEACYSSCVDASENASLF